MKLLGINVLCQIAGSCNSRGENYWNLSKFIKTEGEGVGQTLIKIEHNKIKWEVKFFQKRNLKTPSALALRHGRVLLWRIQNTSKMEHFFLNKSRSLVSQNASSYMLTGIRPYVKLAISFIRSKFHYSIRYQCTLSLPPENIRKPYDFLMFSGGTERVCLGTNGLLFCNLNVWLEKNPS